MNKNHVLVKTKVESLEQGDVKNEKIDANNNKDKAVKLNSRLVLLRLDFWCKKVAQCNINIKKIKPTPKSITHKKPTKISPSSSKSHQPNNIRYNPAKYQRVNTLKVFTK